MAKRSTRERFIYYFDSLMSRGTLSLIGFLAVVSVLFIIVFTIVVWLVNLIPDKGFIELFWLNIFKVLNTGVLDNAAQGQLNFLLSLIIALGSIFIISLLIGLLTAGIQQKIWSLRKGRSRVIETGHTIILGWSQVIFTIIDSLIEANKNQKKYRIVILGNRDKVEMEDNIRERIKLPRNIKIICRQGDPAKLNDLKIVNLFESKSIIILEKPDSKVLKTLLAINNSKPGELTGPVRIVAVLSESSNLDSGKIAGGGHANFVLSKAFISRLVAHTCYQPGLSLIYNDLLSFKGDEIYIANVKELYGKSFKEAIFMFENSTVIGINSSGSSRLNPPGDTIISENDNIIAISADDTTIIPSGKNSFYINEKSISINEQDTGRIEKILILGCNERAKTIIEELKKYISAESEITMLTKEGNPSDMDDIKKMKVSIIPGDIMDYDLLERMVKENYGHVVVLAYQDLDIQEADSTTLMALVHLRDIARKNNLNFSLTSEMLDTNNRELASVAKVNDFIVSEDLTSLLLSQISENPVLSSVFEDLLNEAGSEIYLKKVRDYINIKEEVNFYTLLEAARLRNELAIGYKLSGEIDDRGKNSGIYLNPDKSKYISFGEDDELIVLAER